MADDTALLDDVSAWMSRAVSELVEELRPVLRPERAAREVRAMLRGMDAGTLLAKAEAAGHRVDEAQPCPFCRDIVRSGLLEGKGP